MNSPPFFEDFKKGQDLSQVPAVTVTEGMTALYQGMFGDRSRVYLDQRLSERYTGSDRMLVNPLLVGHIAIGQSSDADPNKLDSDHRTFPDTARSCPL